MAPVAGESLALALALALALFRQTTFAFGAISPLFDGMEILIMGCGTSQGCPLPAHDNPGLDLKDPRNWRARTSVHVVIEGHHVQVDASPEFRTQCLKYDVREVDTFILTHGHADHVLGMDDLRQFCTNKGGAAIPAFSTEVGLERIKAIFPYAVGKPQASGYVSLSLSLMPSRPGTPESATHSAVSAWGSTSPPTICCQNLLNAIGSLQSITAARNFPIATMQPYLAKFKR